MNKTKIINAYLIIVLPLLISCSQNSVSTQESFFLSDFLKKETVNSEIRLDSYQIIGNGLYIQDTSIYSNGDFNKFRNIKINKEKEPFTTIYGGNMAVYHFDDEVVRFWDQYLFIESNVAYKGDFYSAERASIKGTIIKSFKSLHIDTGELRCDNSSMSSDELRVFLNSVECQNYQGQEIFTTPIEKVYLQNTPSLKIYSNKVFSVFQSDVFYELSDNYSFSLLID